MAHRRGRIGLRQRVARAIVRALFDLLFRPRVGRARDVAGAVTKEATLAVARMLHDDVAALLGPVAEPPSRRRWLWLTDLF